MTKELTISKQTMTSREIAELTGKPHNDLMKSIRAMEPAWEKVTGKKFPLIEYQSVTGTGGKKSNPQYDLSKKECLYIATKFNDESRAKLILRWEELELEKQKQSQHEIPQSFSEALMLAAKQAEQIEQQNKLLKEQEPKVAFAESVKASNTSILVGGVAKLLNQNGIDIGQNRLFVWLRENGYLVSRRGSEYNMPTQRAMERKYFEVSVTTIQTGKNEPVIRRTTKVTPKGQLHILDKFLKYKEKSTKNKQLN